MRQRRQTESHQQVQTIDPSVLLNMKKELDEKKARVKTLEGRRSALYDQLKNEFGCSSIEEADEKIKSMDVDLNKKKEDLQIGIQNLQQKYEWSFKNE